MALSDFFSQTKPASDPKRLTSAELNDLERCTEIVDRFVKVHYREAGQALAEIRDKRLYRSTHETFNDFVKTRWNMGENYANRLIAAAGVAQNLTPTGTIPQTERLARPLAALPADDQAEAWNEARDLAGNDPVRPEHVETAVAKRKPKKRSKRPKPLRIRVPGGIVIIETGKGFSDFLSCLRSAIAKLEATQRDAA